MPAFAGITTLKLTWDEFKIFFIAKCSVVTCSFYILHIEFSIPPVTA